MAVLAATLSIGLVPPPAPRTTPRLRVGYVSPDFRRHAVATFFAPVLAAHDRSRMEIHLYGEVPSPDAITEQLKGMADHWLTTCGLGGQRPRAEEIRAHQKRRRRRDDYDRYNV